MLKFHPPKALSGRNDALLQSTIACRTSAEEITGAIDAAKASGAVALNVLSSPFLYGNRQIVMQRVAALRLPAIINSRKKRTKAALSPTAQASPKFFVSK